MKVLKVLLAVAIIVIILLATHTIYLKNENTKLRHHAQNACLFYSGGDSNKCKENIDQFINMFDNSMENESERIGE